jgi:hypothetical protein
MRSSATVALSFVLAFAAAVELSAHRRDEYLQAARIAIAPNRVALQLDLTPGIAVADALIADIDRNHDGVLSSDEQHAYVARVLGDIKLEIDGHPIQLLPQTTTASFPDVAAFRRGEGTVRLESTTPLPQLIGGAHELSYDNLHRRDISVYLANALVPDSDRIAIKDQQRDVDQRDLTIAYTLRDADGEGDDNSLVTPAARVWLCGSIAGAVVWLTLLLRSSRPARA